MTLSFVLVCRVELIGQLSCPRQVELPLPRRSGLLVKQVASRPRIPEELWGIFFSDPSQWWDNRAEKVNPRYPDFKHKKTLDGLWLGHNTPAWVETELAALAPGALQEDTFTWNKRLERYVKEGNYERTMELFQQMKQGGMKLDRFTFVPVLNACSSLRDLGEGRRIHVQVIHSGHEDDLYVSNSLVDMYAKCGSIGEAQAVFNKMSIRNVVSWNALIQGYVKFGQPKEALRLAEQMHEEALEPNPVTFLGVLNACASLAALEDGRHAHRQIIRRGLESNLYVASSLVDMYAKCGSIEDAEAVFNKMSIRNVVSWNALILGYVKCGRGKKALEIFGLMQREKVEPDTVTFLGLLNACSTIVALEEGKCIHEQITRRGYQTDVYVASCLVDMYAKCGSIEDARTVFNNMSVPHVVSWNALILGHVKCGEGLKALELFRRMQREGVEPDPFTFVGALNACSSVAALEEGKRVHQQIIQSGYGSDIFVGSCLVDMYAKCGSIEDAWQMFDTMPKHNVVSWTAMLGGYAMHGHANEALQHFRKMCQIGVMLDGVTFVSLLSACSHGGLVSEGLDYFESMSAVHGISPTVEHYTCMVDLLCRAGCLCEAEDVIKTMSCSPSAAMWRSLLGACVVHGNLQMAERVANHLVELDPGSVAGDFLLSKLYAAAGKWKGSAFIKRKGLDRRLRKQKSQTWIEVNNTVHFFTAKDSEHPQILEIHTEIDRLICEMTETGYVPDTRFLLDNIDEEEKVHLLHHNKKLAIALGLITTRQGAPLL